MRFSLSCSCKRGCGCAHCKDDRKYSNIFIPSSLAYPYGAPVPNPLYQNLYTSPIGIQWRLDVGSIANGFYSRCAPPAGPHYTNAPDGYFYLHRDPLDTAFTESNYGAPCWWFEKTISDFGYQLFYRPSTDGDYWYIGLSAGESNYSIFWRLSATDFNCCGTNVFTYHSGTGTGACISVPSTVTLTPYKASCCCPNMYLDTFTSPVVGDLNPTNILGVTVLGNTTSIAYPSSFPLYATSGIPPWVTSSSDIGGLAPISMTCGGNGRFYANIDGHPTINRATQNCYPFQTVFYGIPGPTLTGDNNGALDLVVTQVSI